MKCQVDSIMDNNIIGSMPYSFLSVVAPGRALLANLGKKLGIQAFPLILSAGIIVFDWEVAMDLSRILLKQLLPTKAEHQRSMKVETEYPIVWPNYMMLMVASVIFSCTGYWSAMPRVQGASRVWPCHAAGSTITTAVNGKENWQPDLLRGTITVKKMGQTRGLWPKPFVIYQIV